MTVECVCKEEAFKSILFFGMNMDMLMRTYYVSSTYGVEGR